MLYIGRGRDSVRLISSIGTVVRASFWLLLCSIAVDAHAQPRQARVPVAPDSNTFMWQTLQEDFLDAEGAACKLPIAVAVSDHGVCFVDASGALRCEGSIYTNTYTFDTPVGPTGVDQVMLSATFNAVDGNAICVHTKAGTAECMGSPVMNQWGQFNTRKMTGSAQFRPWGKRNDIVRIGTGTWDQMCALTSLDEVICTGNGFGVKPALVGYGSAFAVQPWGTVDIDPVADRVSAGYVFCQVMSGRLNCQGVDYGSNVVDGGSRGVPFGGAFEPCALDSSGTVTCFQGERPGPAPAPYELFGSGVLALATNLYTPTMCAVKLDGSLWCAQGGPGTEVQVQPAGSVSTACQAPSTASTPPTIRASIEASRGQNGWLTSDVALTWGVKDAETPLVVKTGCEPTQITADAASLTFACTATSAGGVATREITVKKDATPPVVEAHVAPPANEYGWHNRPVKVTLTGQDALSGEVVCEVPELMTYEGDLQTVYGSCSDAAGNRGWPTRPPVNIDLTPPTIEIASPAVLEYERNAAVPVSYTCADRWSGVLSCVGTVENGRPLDTSRKVNGKFTVTATDKAGHQTSRTVKYRVK